MNKAQWNVLSVFSYVLMFIFIGLDSQYYSCSNFALLENTLNSGDIWCIVSGEIYEPFIYLFFSLGIIFLILGWLESRR